MEKIKKIFNLKTCIYVISFLIPSMVLLLFCQGFDNDIWYILAEGRSILQNGVYLIDPLSMHVGLQVVVQNYLSAVVFWLFYALFGLKSIYLLVVIINLVICFLLYKICMLISNNNKLLSLLTMMYIDINLSLFFVVTRPQIFSFALILLAIYLLELYIKTDKNKYLYFLPLVSIAEINLHASLWVMLILIMIPYLIDSFYCKKLQLQGYKKMPLFIAFVVTFIAGFINPYGIKAITFIFRSFFNNEMHLYIKEMQPFNITNITCAFIFNTVIVTCFLYFFFRDGHIRFRYLCIYAGTLLISLISLKGFGVFITVGIFPIAYLLKDIIKYRPFKKKFIKVFMAIITLILFVVSVSFTSYLAIVRYKNLSSYNRMEKAVDVIDFFTHESSAHVFTSFNDGGYLEFRGYHSYIDPRAEVFLKVNNKKEDIYKEYNDFELELIPVEEFLDKYNFDFIVVSIEDRLYYHMIFDNYFTIYDDNGFSKVYMRNDLVDDEVRNMIIEEYKKSKEN